jgi:hypothetical protein
VLGQEFLAHFDYLLDFGNHRLLFGETTLQRGSRVDFDLIDGWPAIETSEGKLVIDSGTNITVLYRSSSFLEGPYVRTDSGGTSSASPAATIIQAARPPPGPRSKERASYQPACSTPCSSATPAMKKAR